MAEIESRFSSFLDSLGIFSGMAEKIIQSAIILLIGWIVIRILVHVIRRVLDKSSIDAVLHTFILKSFRGTCWIFLVVTILGQLGVPTTTFVTVIGACGAAIALALKDSLGNFAGGILIIVNKPFEQNDLISSNSVRGRVKEIDLLYTIIVTLDNQIITIPNGVLANSVVINESRADIRRINGRFGISYDADIDYAKDVIRKVIEEADYFIDEPVPLIGVAKHGESAVEIDTLVWCMTTDYYNATYYLYEQVKKEFDKAGIEIPYPHVTVQMPDLKAVQPQADGLQQTQKAQDPKEEHTDAEK